MFSSTVPLADFDSTLWQALIDEEQRQEAHLGLIASENYVSPWVLRAQGSVLTNKYAEGYPRKRYYGGCEHVDIVEELAIERAKQLFKAHYVNVQPHSGSQANSTAYMALLQPGDVIMGQSLASGGHLTHGSHVSFSGKIYKAVQYDVDHNTGLLDYDQIADLAKKHQPKMLVAGFSAYAGVVDWAVLRQIADSIGAYFVADIAHVAGLIAVDLYPTPVGIADVVTTTTHKTLRGPRGGLILANDNPEIIKKLQSSLFPGNQGGPMMHIIAAKAVAFKEALAPEFTLYQQQVLRNAAVMAKTLMSNGIKLVTNGTKNHLILVDLRDSTLTGKEAEARLNQVNLVVNKNAVPGDPRPPAITSGLRIGTPAMTTRGLGETEAQQVAEWIVEILSERHSAAMADKIQAAVLAMCQRFPVYKKGTI